MSAPTLVFQHQVDGGVWQVTPYGGLPLDGNTILSLERWGDGDCSVWLGSLAESIAVELGALGAIAQSTTDERAAPLRAQDLAGETTWSGVCVAVDGDHRGRPLESRMRAALDATDPKGAVLPVLTRNCSPNLVLPPQLAELNCDFVEDWATGPEAICDHMLAAARITVPDRRAFISYRRCDSSAMADQLHTALVKADFDVFMDTVDVPPASRFQDVLLEELAHKALVLVLDSPGYAASRWCQEELSFAEQHGLGLVVVRTPEHRDASGSPVPFKPLALPFSPPVVVLGDSDLVDETVPPEQRVLSAPAMESAVIQIKIEHQRALVARRKQLHAEFVACLQSEGLDPNIGLDGLFHVCEPGETDVAFSVGLTARRPQLAEMHRCFSRRKKDGVLVGLLAGLRGHRRRLYDWISDQTTIRLFDVIEMPELARKLREGKL